MITTNQIELIQHCFDEHVKDAGVTVKFTFEEYKDFWLQHNHGDVYLMKNRDKSTVECTIAYYPLASTYLTNAQGITSLKVYDDLRALIEIPIKGGYDLREIPVVFLTKKV
jgi:hypothetical protein